MNIYEEAIQSISAAYQRALDTGQRNMNAMSLATVNSDGYPSIRTVLLKGLSEEGLLFFTDVRSRKGRDLAVCLHASVCMYWEPIEEQIRVDGRVERLTKDLTEADFLARPRQGQLLIANSHQSAALQSVDAFRTRIKAAEASTSESVPVPQYWAGYRLVPNYIETWQGRRDRIHERVAYEHIEGVWTKQLLEP